MDAALFVLSLMILAFGAGVIAGPSVKRFVDSIGSDHRHDVDNGAD